VIKIGEALAVSSERAGSEEAIVGGFHQVGAARSECRYRNKAGLRAHFISAKKV